MAGFGYNSDFNNMRNDAIFRAREMQRRSQSHNAGSNTDNSAKSAEEQPEAAESIAEKSEAPVHAQPADGFEKQTRKTTPRHNGGFLDGILSRLGIGGSLDSDKIVIILLIIILAREGADLKLLLALGYILM